MRLSRDVVERAGRTQAGVVTRGQLVALGADDAWIRRRLDGGHWQRLHAGVLAPWTGPVPWLSRAWAALLAAGADAALSHRSAAHLHGMLPQPPAVIDVTIPHARRAGYGAGVRVHRRVRMPAAGGRPRRTWRADTAVTLVATARSDDDAVGWVTAAARAGTSPAELTAAIARRGDRFARRSLLLELVAEVAEGVESPLERRYRRDVERRHRLPVARLQVAQRLDGLAIRADAVYDGYRTRVELDGALGHPGGRTDADTWRDNAVLLASGDVTLRYRWAHVAADPCTTARQVAQALARGGWHGAPRPCGPACRATRP